MASRYPHSQPVESRVMLPNEGGVPSKRSKYAKAPKPVSADERNTHRRAASQRSRWEASPEGQARTADVNDLLSTQMTKAQVYMAKGWDQQTGIGPKHYDRQLPGMQDPYAAPRPPKWEELPPEAQAHTARSLKAHGTSVEQMSSDFGAQLDQAYVRAERHGADLPYATDFYSHGEPRKVLDASAKELGIPQPVHSVMNALTSPNTKFTQHRKDGTTAYPNDEAARHVVQHVQRGGTAENLSNERTDGRPGRHQGYKTNMRKAAHVMEQYEGGVHPEEWRGLPSKSKPEGKTIWGPKTGPYANSWSDTHPQHFVADVHSGGGGMLPHLSTDKPRKRTDEGEVYTSSGGKEVRLKSEREGAIDRVPYFHSAADYAARQAMAQRGLGSIRDAQAAQWGEEQLQRSIRGSGINESKVYPHRPKSGERTAQIKGQGELF